jgi:hypothetical protein
MSVLVPFAAALLALRLAGLLARSGRTVWAGAFLAYALGSGATAWGSAHGFDATSFRVYYGAGALLTAPLLGAGALELVGRPAGRAVGLVWAGLAVGAVVAMPVHGAFSRAVPSASAHLGWAPRVLAIAGNSAGTVVVVAVALITLRRRVVANSFILAGVACAAVGSALSGFGVAATSLVVAVAVVLLYVGGAPDTLANLRRRAARARAH